MLTSEFRGRAMLVHLTADQQVNVLLREKVNTGVTGKDDCNIH